MNLNYEILEKSTNSFKVSVSFLYSSEIEGVSNKNMDILVFEKINNNWIATSYEEKIKKVLFNIFSCV